MTVSLYFFYFKGKFLQLLSDPYNSVCILSSSRYKGFSFSLPFTSLLRSISKGWGFYLHNYPKCVHLSSLLLSPIVSAAVLFLAAFVSHLDLLLSFLPLGNLFSIQHPEGALKNVRSQKCPLSDLRLLSYCPQNKINSSSSPFNWMSPSFLLSDLVSFHLV